MGWSRLTYSCGHIEDVQLYGPYKDRAYRVQQASGRTCKECARESHAGEAVAAAVSNRLAGLPRLTGTDKQIAWAESIRAAKLQEVDTLLAQVAADPRAQEEPSLLTLYGKLADLVRGQSSASYWINYKSCPAQFLIQAANKGLGRTA